MISALALLGCPAGEGATRVLGEALLTRLGAHGLDVRPLEVAGLLEAHGGRARLLAEVAAADLVVLCCPERMDAPPASVMRALEFLAGEPGPANLAGAGGKRFAALVDTARPEVSHTAVCLDVLRLFARDAGLVWAGGLGVGCSWVLRGSTVEARGRLAARLRRALDMAAESLASGEPVPQEAVRLAGEPLLARRACLFMNTARLLWHSARQGTLLKLRDKPFRQT